MAALLNAGLDTMEKIRSYPRQELEKLVTKPVAGRLLGKAESETAQSTAAEEPARYQAKETSTPKEEEMAGGEGQDPRQAREETGTRLHLAGALVRQRYLAMVDDRETLLPYQSFDLLLRLAVAAKATPSGWLGLEELPAGFNFHQAIWRLKHDFHRSGLSLDGMIENNRGKQYRLGVPPGKIRLNREKLAQASKEWAAIIGTLDRREEGKKDQNGETSPA
jgi:hypothetical protein